MFRIIMLAMLTWLSAGCTPESAAGDDGLTDLDPIVVSRICQTDEGKPYLEVDGQPFPLYGAQIRVDIFRSVDKMDWLEKPCAHDPQSPVPLTLAVQNSLTL